MNKQRVSNWVPTGSHSTCPECGHQDVEVAYFVYDDDTKGWEYSCLACGAKGKAEQK